MPIIFKQTRQPSTVAERWIGAGTASPLAGGRSETRAKTIAALTPLIVRANFGGELTMQSVGGTHVNNAVDGARSDLTIGRFVDPIAWEDRSSSREAALAEMASGKLGFAEVSLAELACDAGTTTGARYHHFADKKVLFAASLRISKPNS